MLLVLVDRSAMPDSEEALPSFGVLGTLLDVWWVTGLESGFACGNRMTEAAEIESCEAEPARRWWKSEGLDAEVK